MWKKKGPRPSSSTAPLLNTPSSIVFLFKTMLRFFEPETDTWFPVAAPPLPPRRRIATADPRLQEETRHCQNSDPPAMPVAAAGRRVPSALATVDLVKGRWFPAPPPENNGSRSSSPNSSSSPDSMNSNCCISISWPNRDANFILESPSDPSLPLFQGEGSSSKSVNTARKDQHETKVDWKKKRRSENMEASRESKKQKEGLLLNYLPLVNNSTSSSPSKMLPTQEVFKGSAAMSKSMKIGEKITALQQLVSPFGKTDTSSVLHEAAIYIQTLHEQIRVLSRHYFESILRYETDQVENGGERYIHHRQKKLTSFAEAGLCMVQISPSITNLLNQEQLDRYVNESLPW